jgi:ABC-type xylose transport system permease subunit
MRLALGILLYKPLTEYYLLAAIFIIIFSFQLLKRAKEIEFNEKVNRPIGFYTIKKIRILWIISLILLIILTIFSEDIEQKSIRVILLILTIVLSLFSFNKKAKALFVYIAD